MTKAKANRAHKDRLFRLIFREKKDLLSLYSAVDRAVDVCLENGVLKQLLPADMSGNA